MFLFSSIKKRLTNTLHPQRGFVKIYSSIAFSRKLCPKRLLIVDFKTEKYLIEKHRKGWEVSSNKSGLSENKYIIFKNDDEVCAYFKKILFGVYRECIEK